MNLEKSVTEHYTAGSLLEAILSGIKTAGKTVDSIQLVDLAPLDEFYISGREATMHLLGQMEFRPNMQVLDIGCGLGGAARFSASQYGCQVTGIDLTQEFIRNRENPDFLAQNGRAGFLETGQCTADALPRFNF